ncbi:MAG: hypothetical protein KH440_12520, partial [Oscillospiraceae bacterium]|nr:hypothetical protein [Oscillospiraceae bacterium]
VLTQLADPYYALHASARNKGLCPHSDNHQLRWWMCSFVGLLQNRCLKNRSKEKVSENRRCGGSHSLFSYTNFSFGPENRILQQALYRFGVSNTRGKVNLRLPGRQQLLPIVGTAVAAVKACADLLCPAPEPLGQGNTIIHAVFRAVCEAGNRGELDFRM